MGPEGDLPMRLSTVITLAALGAAGYYAYRLNETAAQRRSVASVARTEPIVMWFETIDERTALCEGAD